MGALELLPFRSDRNGAPDFCFDAFSSREPASTSLENALRRGRLSMRLMIAMPVSAADTHCRWSRRTARC
ncbi:hypothetical protein FNJ47_13285 [Bradyrhizobium sp. UFLA 03-164]|uniref:Uncharacterized protein n=1 Tax=Bradyrhizobium uaiense TaxID=2594946 RepID=A0A6P1BEB6_9BRAD|nr:hypothetical protein [Bradyrhizobium uaiense]